MAGAAGAGDPVVDVVGVVGAGTMGRGIAQIAAAGGYRVLLHDSRAGAAVEGREFAARMLRRAAEKGAMTGGDAEAACTRIETAGGLAALAPCGVVVEAIVEDLDAKKALFAELEAVVAEDCILASNTSSLPISAIAAGCRTPGRVAGWHFFNPVPLLKVVEVVCGLLTEPWVGEALEAIARRCGHRPVRAGDSPGFLVNHAGRGLYTEGLRILQEGIADPQTIDDVLREGGAGFRMGPFELMDTTGLDVSGVVMESIYRQFYDEPRFRPVAATRRRMEAGLFGRKTGRGYYRYRDGRKQVADPPPVPDARPASVWVSPADPAGQAAVMAAVGELAPVAGGAAPAADSLCLVTPVGEDATAACLAQGLPPERTVAVDTLFGLDGRRTLMTTPATDPAFRDQAHALFAADGSAVSTIHDSPGFVAQRVVAAIVNVACDIAQQRIAAPEDVDAAVRLGLAYPHGPIAWGDRIGPARVLAVLDALWTFYRDPRYRPSPWLLRRARLGLSLAAPEG